MLYRYAALVVDGEDASGRAIRWTRETKGLGKFCMRADAARLASCRMRLRCLADAELCTAYLAAVSSALMQRLLFLDQPPSHTYALSHSRPGLRPLAWPCPCLPTLRPVQPLTIVAARLSPCRLGAPRLVPALARGGLQGARPAALCPVSALLSSCCGRPSALRSPTRLLLRAVARSFVPYAVQRSRALRSPDT